MSISLTIDESRVKECLETSNHPLYVVRALNLDAEIPRQPIPPSWVGGTTAFGTLRATADDRDHIMLLRRKIEESGAPLKSANELSKEIDEMRGKIT
jgi:hypothetical protein